MLQTSIIALQILCLPDLFPWIYLSPPLCNHKGIWFRSYLNGLMLLFTFFKPEFCNKKLVSWVRVIYMSCFCWIYRAFPSSAAKKVINLISVLIIWWCTSGDSSLVLSKDSICYHQFSLRKTVSLCPDSFCTPRPNLPAIPSRYLLTSYFCIQIPYDE